MSYRRNSEATTEGESVGSPQHGLQHGLEQEPRVLETLHGRVCLDVPGDHILQVLEARSAWEPHVLLALARLFSKPTVAGTTFVDCGAHVGLHSLAAARLPSCGGAVAVEMMAQNCRRLARNLALNPHEATKIRVVRAALSDVDGLTVQVSNPPAFGGTGMARIVSGAPDRSILPPEVLDIRSQTLDGVLRANLAPDARVGVVKVDVEGHEVKVLRGALGALRRWRPFLIVEVWGASSAARNGTCLRQEEVVEQIEALGYRGRRLAGGRNDFLFTPAAVADTPADTEFEGTSPNLPEGM